MKSRVEVPEGLVEVAARQQGVVSRGQIVGWGVSDEVLGRLVRSGQWRRLATGVYAINAETWLQWVHAGLLVAGGTAVVGLRAAAQLWGLPIEQSRRRYQRDERPRGGPARPATTATNGPAAGIVDRPIEIFVGRGHRAPATVGPWQFIRADRVGESSPPRTSIAQTIVDLAETMSGDELASLVGQSLRRVRPAEVRETLARTRHRQRKLLTEVLADAEGGVASALERRYAHDVERAHGLPRAQRQAKPVGIFTVDNLYDHDVIVELDSQAYHRGAAASRDIDRDRTHAQHGFITLRYTWSDVADHPCRTATDVATTLVGRGWPGWITRCPRCQTQPVRPVSPSAYVLPS